MQKLYFSEAVLTEWFYLDVTTISFNQNCTGIFEKPAFLSD